MCVERRDLARAQLASRELPQESLHRGAQLADLLAKAAVPVEVQRGQKTLEEWGCTDSGWPDDETFASLFF